jgi:hypothetical protein
MISATENGNLIVYRHEFDCDKECMPPLSSPVPCGRHKGRDAPWQFRFLIAAFKGLVSSVLVYQKTSRCFFAAFPSELRVLYILCTTSSFVPPWKGIISPWSLNPRSRYSVTRTPRLQAARVLAMMGDALNVGV